MLFALPLVISPRLNPPPPARVLSLSSQELNCSLAFLLSVPWWQAAYVLCGHFQKHMPCGGLLPENEGSWGRSGVTAVTSALASCHCCHRPLPPKALPSTHFLEKSSDFLCGITELCRPTLRNAALTKIMQRGSKTGLCLAGGPKRSQPSISYKGFQGRTRKQWGSLPDLCPRGIR